MSSSSDDSESPNVPAGVLKSRSGWDEQLERERRVGDTRSAVAVDLGQFRNTQVGSGYQARNVIRQSAVNTKVKIIRKDVPLEREEDRKKLVQDDGGANNKDKNLRRYIRCRAFREFRKEIEKIVNS
jgi:hypothetical protein